MNDGRSIEELLSNTTALTLAFRSAVHAEIVRHRRLGNTIAVWSGDQVTLMSSDVLDDTAPEESSEESSGRLGSSGGNRELSP